MKKFLVLAAMAAGMTSTAAFAGPTVTFPGALPDLTGKLYTDFETGNGPFTISGGAIVGPGTTPGQYAAPAGDATKFFAVGPSTSSPGTISIEGKQISSLGFLWGSIDTYNSVTVNYLDGTSEVLNSTNINGLLPADGDQTDANTNKYVQFDFDKKVSSVSLSSTSNAFELDNLYVSAVPEPAAWALMISGFGVIGGALRTRSRKSVAFA